MKRLCIFCGSSYGTNALYKDAARQLAELLVKKKITLVYGGGRLGLMGELSATAMKFGGEVIGIIPKVLTAKELANTSITTLHVVSTMHERKAMMAGLADGFIAMPGGIGTLEEFSEILTWAQLGLHRKPCGLLNVGGYYDKLIEFLDHAVKEKFVKQQHRSLLLIEKDPEKLLELMNSFVPPVHFDQRID